MYFLYSTKLDTAFIVGQLNKYNPDSRKNLLQAAKSEVRYLKKTIEMGLTFNQKLIEQLPQDLLLYGMVNYADNNFAKDLED